MDNTTRGSGLAYRISGIVVVLIALTLSVIFFRNVRSNRYDDGRIDITDHFDVNINGAEYHDVDITSFSFPALKKGDHIEYSFELPGSEIPNPVLRLYLDHVAVIVYLDGIRVYQKGSPESLMLGYGYINVSIPAWHEGMKVRVEMDSIENNGVSSIATPAIYDYRGLSHNYVAHNSLYLVIDLAIIIICLTMMLISAVFSGAIPSLSRLVFLGMAFFMMGVWEMCSYDLVSIFSDSLVLKGYLEYPSLYAGPFFITVYFYLDFFKDEPELFKKIYRVVLFVQGAFPVVTTILHFADIIHYPAVLPAFHIITLINVVTVLVVLTRQAVNKNTTHRSLIIGLIVMIAFAVNDLLRFNVYKYFGKGNLEGYVSYLLLGFFVFLVALIVDFLLNQRRTLYKLARAEAMDKLAHVDIMTGLANRLRFEEILKDMSETSSEYGIISIDINYLKITNDKYGHQEGDRLLTEFAEILKAACEGTTATACRVGGDEYVITVMDMSGITFDEIAGKIRKICDEKNADRKPLPISFSYGCCSSRDGSVTNTERGRGQVEEVYKIADSRMYEMKSLMKRRKTDNRENDGNPGV